MSYRTIALASILLATPALADDVPLKPGPGVETVEANCAACHTTNYIRMNAPFLSPDAWKAEVTKMRVAFGSPIDDDVAKEIVAYLVAQYGAKP